MEIKDLKKKYKDTFFEWGTYPDTNFISTWFSSLDFIIGGGIPEWRVIEIFGNNWSGKTTLSMQIAEKFTDRWDKVLFVDTERTFPARLGNPSIDVTEPDCWEDAIDRIMEGIESWYKLIILDSVAATVPMVELDTSADQMNIGKQARLMNRMMRMVPSVLRMHWATLLLINQFRTNIGGYWNPNQTTGGTGIPYACSLRMEIATMPKKDWILNKEGELELKPARIKVVKTKMKWWTDEWVLYLWSDGRYSELMDILIMCLQYSIIEKKWSFIKYWEDTMGQWLIKAALYLQEHPEILDVLNTQLQERLKIKVASSGLLFSTQESKDIANELIKEYNKKWGTKLDLY